MRAGGARPPAILFAHDGEDWIRGSERCLLDLVARLDRDRFHPVVWCNAPTLSAAAAGAEVRRAPSSPRLAGAFPVDRALVAAARVAERFPVGRYVREVEDAYARLLAQPRRTLPRRTLEWVGGSI